MNLPVEKRRQWIRSRRQQRKLSKLARLRRQFLRYSMLSALLFAGAVAFYKIHWNLCENLYNKNSQCIVIKGNLIASDAQIRQTLDSSINTFLFSINPQDLEKKVENLSIIRRAFVRRYALPYPKLQISVLEEFPWATLYLNDAPAPQFVIAQSGRRISIHDFPSIYQPPLRIYGLSKEQSIMNADEVDRWADWVAYIEKQMQCPVLAIDMRDPHNVMVETGKFNIALGNPDSSLTNRLYRLASVLDIMASEHKQPTYVNLGLNSNIPIKLVSN